MGYIVSTNKNHLIKPNAIKHNTKIYYTLTQKNLKKNSGIFLEGYLRAGKHNISEKNISTLIKDWPLPERYSGSYAFTVVSEDKIILANDCIGIYPLYYYLKNGEFTTSNSLFELQKALKLEIDEVGKAQRLFAPENSEIGSRTILKDLKRLLPGEKITFNIKTNTIQKSYDNRLYAKMHHNIDREQILSYWKLLQDEIQYIENLNETTTDIALSGGLDSRILIGAMTSNSNTIAYHYGKPEYYETKVAKKIADCCGIQFKSEMDHANQFPLKEDLEHTIKTVGTIYSMNFYNIFNIAKPHKTNLIIGDMCEALHGRNIKAFSSRKKRIKNYFKHYLLNRPYSFTPATKKRFRDWKKAKIKNYWNYIQTESLIKETKFKIENYREQINSDLDKIFKRVEDHQLPYIELYDELFTWFTHSRIPMGRQITHCNERFYAYAPTMSSAILIATSNIHPNLRLNYRFQNELFKYIKPFRKLNSIPTNQVPIVSKNAPDFLQFLIWGIRSTTDQIFIKRILKTKNPSHRYRLFKSLNWVEVYQNKFMDKRLKSYFEKQNISKDVIQASMNLALNRKNLNAWPLANYDIMSIAILNLEIELLKNKQV